MQKIISQHILLGPELFLLGYSIVKMNEHSQTSVCFMPKNAQDCYRKNMLKAEQHIFESIWRLFINCVKDLDFTGDQVIDKFLFL